jgi:hypothetical protein
MAVSSATPRGQQRAAQAGVQIEQVTVGWMVGEAVLTIGAGIAAHSLLLVAFGLDSVIELLSGGILLWRLTLQAHDASLERVEEAERRSAWVIACALTALGSISLPTRGWDSSHGRSPTSRSLVWVWPPLPSSGCPSWHAASARSPLSLIARPYVEMRPVR